MDDIQLTPFCIQFKNEVGLLFNIGDQFKTFEENEEEEKDTVMINI